MSTTSIDSIDGITARLHLPLWIWPSLGTLLLLLAVGGGLLSHPDTWWHIAVGDWILRHDAFPRTDTFSFSMKEQPWISASPAAQIVLAAAFRMFGWTGVVAATALAVALAIGLLARFLGERLPAAVSLIFAIAALVLALPQVVARPHAIALPVMVAWSAGLIAAADRRGEPSFWLLPLMALWANLHGSFVLGLALAGAMAIDATLNAPAGQRGLLAKRWCAFGACAVVAACVTPYTWNSLLAAWHTLTLGEALPMLTEWQPRDFGKVTSFEIVVMSAIAIALWRGVTLPPFRILMLLGLLYMALASVRLADVLGFVAPLLLAAPLSAQIGGSDERTRGHVALLVPAVLLAAAVAALLTTQRYAPPASTSPAAAVAALRQHDAQRPLNDYSFGGYMIAAGIEPFIDGRTGLYGRGMVMQHDRALSHGDARELISLIERYDIDSTLLMPATPAVKLFDRMHGWQRVFEDTTAVVHVRKPRPAPARPR
jgi:hypothetical protein